MLQIPRLNFLIAFVFAGIGIAQIGYGNNGGGPNECLEPPVDDPDDPRPTPSHVWADWPDCEWVLPVALSPSESQGYPASDIHPDICLNAQSEYTTTKFDVSIGLDPDTATATISVESGDVSVDNTTVSDGDTITVTGNTKGSYQIKITHDVETSKSETYNGTVFEFQFASLSLVNSSSDVDGNASVSPLNTVTCSTTQSAGEGSAGFAQQDFEIKVETDPSGAYSGKVDAKVVVDQKYSYDVTLAKGQQESGDNLSLSLAWEFLSFSWGGAGSSETCGYGVTKSIKIDTGSWSNVEVLKVDTGQFSINPLSPLPYATNNWQNSNYTGQKTDNEREYDLGSSTQHYDLLVRIGAAANSSMPLTGAGYEGASASDDSEAQMWTGQFELSEDDDTYEIK